MTEYELASLAMEAQNTVTSVFALFLTIVGGYLLAAWMVGSKLERTQFIIVNILFVFVEIQLLAGWFGRWSWFWHYYEQARALNPLSVPNAEMVPFLIPLTGLLMLCSVFGAVKFMWDVRHPKNE
jgi:hypothetical protein